VKREPRVRPDGLCALKTCRKPRNPKRNPYSGIAPSLDPFCSSSCCKEYHEVTREWAPYHSAEQHPERRQQLAPCGTESAYTRGCRCDRCRRAATKARRDRRRRSELFTTNALGRTALKIPDVISPYKGRIVAGISHGSHWSYQHHRCRCDVCVHEERRRIRERKARKREAKAA
jgi:hypothetical protein